MPIEAGIQDFVQWCRCDLCCLVHLLIRDNDSWYCFVRSGLCFTLVLRCSNCAKMCITVIVVQVVAWHSWWRVQNSFWRSGEQNACKNARFNINVRRTNGMIRLVLWLVRRMWRQWRLRRRHLRANPRGPRFQGFKVSSMATSSTTISLTTSLRDSVEPIAMRKMKKLFMTWFRNEQGTPRTWDSCSYSDVDGWGDYDSDGDEIPSY